MLSAEFLQVVPAVLAAWITGLVGSGHCLAMCGGVSLSLRAARNPPALNLAASEMAGATMAEPGVATVTTAADMAEAGAGVAVISASGPVQHRVHFRAPHASAGGFATTFAKSRELRGWLATHAGRVATYTLAGTLAGGLGSAAWFAASWIPVQAVLFTLFNLTLIWLGARLMGWQGARVFSGVSLLGFWRRLSPWTRRFWPPLTVTRQLACGLAWGLVPCGFMYSVLALALWSGEWWHGALIMAAFGLGTLPTLGAFEWGGGRLQRSLSPAVAARLKGFAGVALIAWALHGLWASLRAAQDPFSLVGAFAAWCRSVL